jgi:hypothetical protein
MSQIIINTGNADKGNGDPIRIAFTKVNDNFTELYTLLSSTTIDNNPPDAPSEGALWWDPVSGRLFISYNSNWVDASPVDGVGNNAYTPSAESDWSDTPPTTITEAIDRLATLVKILNNGVGA